MNQIRSAEDLQKLAESLASVCHNSKKADVLIFGAGTGGLAMLEALKDYNGINITAIVDITENAPAFALARHLGIKTSTQCDEVLASFREGIVIDVTGDPELYKKLDAFSAPHHIELISAKSAKLLFDLANHQLHDEQTIQSQSARMGLLDSMLEVTLLLESRPPLNDITCRSFEDIHGHIQATKGLAVMFDKADGAVEFIGAIGDKKPACEGSTCDFSACSAIRKVCSAVNKVDRFKKITPPIRLGCSELDTEYNIILPVWQDAHLAGALLFDIQGELSKEQVSSLEMASAHLNMTFKTLDHLHKLEEMAIFDALTGVFNRRKFDMQLHHEVSRIKRTRNGTLSCGFIDLDDFKQINDTYGHGVGDLVLTHIAQCIESSLRDYDICARYGGDEFVILIPADDAIEGDGLELIGMRILEKVSRFRLEKHPEIRASVSIGICTQSSETVDAVSLMKLADDALYQAKKSGKGCLRIKADEQFHYRESKKQSSTYSA
ncbi:diguanylate cyclase (GGDEF) domain-containing protein [Mariprofundus aestuarium]|uniref:Diguanylate cyclase (GGDEF) domain-containing protein n=1 Tax=Mariprofundus aestuarium TaxID=1921086 RepID=A0A2K8KXL3_MARES|nr:diguanylate cyclase [Mariprofundus aestuarium]ATX79613.1 diguanylate cyclase (GGDEF) domain-containing protein [Mariprofundus aestuarium]